MNPLGLLFSNKGSLGLGLINSFFQQGANDQALAENRKRYGQSTDINLGQLGSGNSLGDIGWAARDAGIDLPSLRSHNAGVLSEYDASGAGLANRLHGQGQGLMSDYEAGAAALQKGYDDRLFRNMARVDQIGDQERRDINRSFDEQAGTAVQDAAARGLGGSTVAQGLRSNVNVQRQDALGRLNDRILANKINTDSALSGDAANAAMGLFQGRQALGQNIAGNEFALDAQQSGGRLNLRDAQFKDAFNFGNQALGNINATISGATDAYPSQSTFMDAMSGLGQNIGYNQYIASLNKGGLGGLFGLGGGAAAGGGVGLAVGAATGNPLLGLLGGAGLGGMFGQGIGSGLDRR